MGRTTDEIRKRIQEKEERLNRELTRSERRKIEATVKRKVHRQKVFAGILLSLGITTAGGVALLNSGENVKANNTKIEAEADIEKSDSEKFREKYNVMKNVEVERRRIEEEIKPQIDSLQNSQEVMNYLKEYYINDYNQQYNADVKKEELTFYSTNEEKLKRDVAWNGDEIIRHCSSDEPTVDLSYGLIRATIRNENGVEKQETYNDHGEYKNVYGKDEIVQHNDNTLLVKMAPMIDAGIDWAYSMNQEGNSSKVIEGYKEEFLKAIVEYEMLRPSLGQENKTHQVDIENNQGIDEDLGR